VLKAPAPTGPPGIRHFAESVPPRAQQVLGGPDVEGSTLGGGFWWRLEYFFGGRWGVVVFLFLFGPGVFSPEPKAIKVCGGMGGFAWWCPLGGGVCFCVLFFLGSGGGGVVWFFFVKKREHKNRGLWCVPAVRWGFRLSCFPFWYCCCTHPSGPLISPGLTRGFASPF